ncbi:hypothetical protein, partial [Agrobacterium tumefaciens]|uniref:hypothetical protein n=1 Tax=Agrobacterium tumefaciens TaxID=358 RepID=UPI003BA3D72D
LLGTRDAWIDAVRQGDVQRRAVHAEEEVIPLLPIVLRASCFVPRVRGRPAACEIGAFSRCRALREKVSFFSL